MSTILQSGTVTPGHVATWTISGVLQDGGTAAAPYINALGVYGSGGTPFTITNSSYPGSQSGSPATVGMGVTSTTAYTTVNNAGTYQVTINGVTSLSLTQAGTLAVNTITLQNPIPVASGGTGLTAPGAAGTVLTSTGTNTPLAWGQLPSVWSQSVRSFGAVGDGVTDDTAAIQAAFNAGVGYFPKGTYLVRRSVYIPSNLLVHGDGAESVIYPAIAYFYDPDGTFNPIIGNSTNGYWIPNSVEGGTYDDYAVFKNANWAAAGVRTDSNITIRDLRIAPNLGAGNSNTWLATTFPNPAAVGLPNVNYWNGHAIAIRNATNILIENVTFVNCADAVASRGNNFITVQNCYATNAVNCAWDFWEGNENATVNNNLCVGPSTGVNWNGTREYQTGYSVSVLNENIVITNNKFFDNFVAIFLSPLQLDTITRFISILDNYVSISSTNLYSTYGFACQNTDKAYINNNTFSGCFFNPITLTNLGNNAFSNVSRYCTVSNNTFENCVMNTSINANWLSYITAYGPYQVVEGNKSVDSSATYGCRLSDSTSRSANNNFGGLNQAFFDQQSAIFYLTSGVSSSATLTPGPYTATGYILGTTLTVTAVGAYPSNVSPRYVVTNATTPTAVSAYPILNDPTTGIPAGNGGTGVYTVANSQTFGSRTSPVSLTVSPFPAYSSGFLAYVDSTITGTVGPFPIVSVTNTTIVLGTAVSANSGDRIRIINTTRAPLNFQSDTVNSLFTFNFPIVFPTYTTTQKNAISGYETVLAGTTVFDSTLGRLSTYNAATSSWT